MIKFHLKSLLAQKNMTQKELVNITKIRQPTLSAMNMGKSERLNVKDIDKICIALKCQPGDLFTCEHNENPQE